MVLEKRENANNTIQVESSCWWNQGTDGTITLEYTENPNMSVVVTLFACAL